jgi:hypothetical protein
MHDLPPEFEKLFGTLKKPEQLTAEQKFGLELLKISKQFNNKKDEV